jgi:hypothetical protein
VATTHREAPASAARAITADGVRRLSNQGPAMKNTTTSAATDNDQSKLIVCDEMPAARQRMTENVVQSVAAQDERGYHNHEAEFAKT